MDEEESQCIEINNKGGHFAQTNKFHDHHAGEFHVNLTARTDIVISTQTFGYNSVYVSIASLGTHNYFSYSHLPRE